MTDFIPYIISGVGALMSVGSFVVAYYRVSREDLRATRTEMKELEHRLTTCENNQFTDKDKKEAVRLAESLENNKFTDEDRKCLQEVKLKMDMFWTIVERDFPKLIKQVKTPVLDKLLEKAEVSGVSTLQTDEIHILSNLLSKEFDKAATKEDDRNVARAIAISFYRAVLNFPKEKEKCSLK